MAYDDFEGKAIPLLLERIKVNLWNRHINFYAYIGRFAPQPLLMKSLFLDEESAIFKEQESFDREILKHSLFDFEDPHPKLEEFEKLMAAKKLKVTGYSIHQL